MRYSNPYRIYIEGKRSIFVKHTFCIYLKFVNNHIILSNSEISEKCFKNISMDSMTAEYWPISSVLTIDCREQELLSSVLYWSCYVFAVGDWSKRHDCWQAEKYQNWTKHKLKFPVKMFSNFSTSCMIKSINLLCFHTTFGLCIIHLLLLSRTVLYIVVESAVSTGSRAISGLPVMAARWSSPSWGDPTTAADVARSSAQLAPGRS